MTDIHQQLTIIKQRIADYALKYHREKNAIRLLAVSKGQSLEKIQEAIQGGQYLFGESYLQESLEKIHALHDKPLLEWHFIGPMQRNKTRQIAEHFAWVHSLDNIHIAKRLHEQRPAFLPPLNICIQVNVSGEKTKSGIHINDLPLMIKTCLSLPRLRLRGLMTIPAPQHTFALQRQSFHVLFLAWQSLCKQYMEMDTLSMGMSDDFEAAIAEGSTLVRIGTAIFGERHAASRVE